MIISTLCSTPQFQICDCLIHCAQNFRILFINYHMNRVCSFLCLALKEERIMPVVTGEPAGKAFFDYRCMKMKLGGQYSGKWSISPIYVSKPLITVITAICKWMDKCSDIIPIQLQKVSLPGLMKRKNSRKLSFYSPTASKSFLCFFLTWVSTLSLLSWGIPHWGLKSSCVRQSKICKCQGYLQEWKGENIKIGRCAHFSGLFTELPKAYFSIKWTIWKDKIFL